VVENRCGVFVGQRGQFRVIDSHVMLTSAEPVSDISLNDMQKGFF